MSALTVTHDAGLRVKEFLNHVSNSKRIGENKWSFSCPCHDDADPSATITISDDKLLVGCFGCNATAEQIMDAVGLPMSYLFLESIEQQPSGCSTAAMSQYSAIPENVLRRCEWENTTYNGVDAIVFPYRGANNAVTGRRYRLCTSGKDKYRWASGVNAREQLYMAQLAKRRSDYAILVEGETDTISLRMNGYNAFGVPGANLLSESNAQFLKHCETVYVWREDEASTPMIEAAKKYFGTRVKIIDACCGGDKLDANMMWRRTKDKTAYNTVVDAMMCSAVREIDNDTLDVVFIEDIAPEITRPIVSSFVYEGKMTILAGAPGTGKTTFVAYMAHCIANNDPFFTSVVVPKRICWIDRDDPIERIVEHKFSELGHVAPGMICSPKKLAGVDINEETYEQWAELIKRADIGILVLDTLRQAVGVSRMSDSTSEGKFAQKRIELLRKLCNETGVAVVGITHTNKASGASQGPTGVHAVYGATEWVAGVDAVYVLSPVQDDSTLVTLSCAKNRLADSHWYMELRKDRQRFVYEGNGTKHLGPEELIVGLLKRSGSKTADSLSDAALRCMSDSTFKRALDYLIDVKVITSFTASNGSIIYKAEV